MSVTELLAPWEALNDALGLTGPIRDEAHYEAQPLIWLTACFFFSFVYFAIVMSIDPTMIRTPIVGGDNYFDRGGNRTFYWQKTGLWPRLGMRYLPGYFSQARHHVNCRFTQ